MVSCTLSPATPVTGRVTVIGAEGPPPLGKFGAAGIAEKSTYPSGTRPVLQKVWNCANVMVGTKRSRIKARMRFTVKPRDYDFPTKVRHVGRGYGAPGVGGQA